MIIQKALRLGHGRLRSSSDAPDLDAERLLLWVLGKPETSWLYAHSQDRLNENKMQEYLDVIALRQTGRPLAYITGESEFYGRSFHVNDNVLVPRSNTEELVAQALPIIKHLQNKLARPIAVADIGTGSGCIIITLALELAEGNFLGTDISAPALAVAKHNAQRHFADKKINWLLGDLLAPLANLPIDLIVSNPPYVPTDYLGQPSNNDTLGLTFEPRMALDGGLDGKNYTDRLKKSGIPTIIESTGGLIERFGID